MRLTREAAKDVNRQALIRAARTLVAQVGPSVRVEVIAEAAGLTTGAVYSIFGSKPDLMIAVLVDDIGRIDAALGALTDPALTLRGAIERYVDAWFASYSDDSVAQEQFELHVFTLVATDSRLRAKLADALEAEVDKLASVLGDRVIDGLRPRRRTTPGEAREIAAALKATITGFAVRHAITPQPAELVRASCLAVAALVRKT